MFLQFEENLWILIAPGSAFSPLIFTYRWGTSQAARIHESVDNSLSLRSNQSQKSSSHRFYQVIKRWSMTLPTKSVPSGCRKFLDFGIDYPM